MYHQSIFPIFHMMKQFDVYKYINQEDEEDVWYI